MMTELEIRIRRERGNLIAEQSESYQDCNTKNFECCRDSLKSLCNRNRYPSKDLEFAVPLSHESS